MTLCSNGPVWTVEDTENFESEFTNWLNGRIDNTQNRREFAKCHFGSQGRLNLVCDLSEYYIGGIHLGFRSAETICHHIGQCATGFLKSSNTYYSAISKLARHVKKEDGTIKFDEIGVHAFGEKMPSILEEAGFSGFPLEVLSSFTSGLSSIYHSLLDTPISLTGCQFECLARLHLGFPFVIIFGTSCVTPSIKQIVAYTAYYVDKARSDGNLVGTPLKFSNFSDATMETAHKNAKLGTFLYSGGRHGATSSTEYQKLILSQIFHNELYRITDRETNSIRSTEAKVIKKRFLKSSNTYYSAISKLARHVKKEDGTIKFDEIGVHAFGEKMPSILEEAGFSGFPLEVLSSFTSGLSSIYHSLLDTPISLTGCQFECLARLHLGFPFVIIFGTSCVTPSIKQIVAYTAYYVDKARSDGNLVGTPLKFSNFSDATMETAHKNAKLGTFLYSGGRHGATSSTEYQKLILSQIFHNELYRITDRETNSIRSTEAKVIKKRELEVSSEDENCCNLKRKKQIPFQDFKSKIEPPKESKSASADILPEQTSTSSAPDFLEANCYDKEYTGYLSTDDISAMSSQMVTVSNLTCEQLKQVIINYAKSNWSQENVQYVSKTAAEEYSKSTANQKGVLTFHLDSDVITDFKDDTKRFPPRSAINVAQVVHKLPKSLYQTNSL
ncbi:hypothetical protein AC249_AIPGENE8086 [Exaiptasia diaphana]|nr:hypothetical protein AC249_AIPGENE8086 [Exaiptasia diaphana]